MIEWINYNLQKPKIDNESDCGNYYLIKIKDNITGKIVFDVSNFEYDDNRFYYEKWHTHRVIVAWAIFNS